MFCTQFSARLGVALLLLWSAMSVHAQDPRTDLLRALGRVVEAAKPKQAQPKQTLPESAQETKPDTSSSTPLAAPTLAAEQQPSQPAVPVFSERTTPPPNEAKAIYDKARSEGRSDEDAWILGELAGYVKQMHAAAAGPNQLAFKNLKVGADFPMSIGRAPSTTRRNVMTLQEGTAPEMNREKPKQGSVESWRCWTQTWGLGIQCLLVESPELTTAFGQSLSSVEILLTKPEYDYQPLVNAWQEDMHARIAVIHIVADGGRLAKAANEYASGVFHTAPKVARSNNENGATPSRAACAAVNAKRVADLTTDDLALRRSCANPTVGLFKAMETPETLYKYENTFARIDVVERALIDGSVRSSMSIGSTAFNRLAEKWSERIQTLRDQYAARKAKAGQKDF